MPFIHCPPGAFNLAEAFDCRRSGRTLQNVHLSRLWIRKWGEHNTQPKHSSPLRQRPVKARHQMFLLNPGSLNYCFNEDLFLFVVLFQSCDKENSAHYFDLIRRHARCVWLCGHQHKACTHIKHTVWLAPTLTWTTEMQRCLTGWGEAFGRGRWGEYRRGRIDPLCQCQIISWRLPQY